MHNPYYSYYIYNLIYKYKGVFLCVFFFLTLTTTRGQETLEIQIANEYYLKGEKSKAVDLYAELAKADNNIPLIHNNYFNTLIDLGKFDDAQNYVKRIIKKDPSNLQYKLDQGILYMRAGEVPKADKYFKELIAANKSNIQSAKMISDYLAARSLLEYSEMALTEARQVLDNNYLYSLELAMLYRLQGEKDKMVNEYLNYVTQSSANIQYVKNVMQALLTDTGDLETLEKLLYQKVQQSPNTEVYSDLLIWVTMQQKNFFASFIQARAYDKRYKKDGDKCMEVAKVALDNEDYVNAAKIYRYVAKEFPNSPNYLMARLGLINTREAEIKNTYPVNIDSVKSLIVDYNQFIRQYPNNTYSLEAERSEAILYANYLDEKDSAIVILEKLVANPKATLYLKSKAKLDLGDIYLLREEPWESTLLYSQVEKAQHESTLGYEAKLRNAKLSYYKGDFKLAQEHLDILKEATTREISNDAMDLSMRIKENIATDSTGEALKGYASIELLLYQHKTDVALRHLQRFYISKPVKMSATEAFEMGYLKGDLVLHVMTNRDSVVVETGFANSTYQIMDDVYWLEANIRLKKGEFDKTLELLTKINEQYPDDILADDSYFLQGEIYERQLGDKEKAKELYREFLNKYPGSVYAAEARKRYRILRGDFNQQPQIP